MAYIGAAGILLDAFGGLYLAYDLLGGQEGPLSLLTRGLTYSLLFGLGYGIPFGLFFGAVSGLGLGIILALEFRRVARHQRLYGSSPLNHVPIFGVARGVVFGAAAVRPFGGPFAFAFGLLSCIFLYVVYRLRYAPTYDYHSHTAPVFSKRRVVASIWRGAALSLAGVLAGWITQDHLISPWFALEIGVTAGLVSVTVSIFSPFIEWWADNLPGKNLGTLGVIMILLGLLLQSSQYLAVILDIPIH
jgi:hypothetical protein